MTYTGFPVTAALLLATLVRPSTWPAMDRRLNRERADLNNMIADFYQLRWLIKRQTKAWFRLDLIRFQLRVVQGEPHCNPSVPLFNIGGVRHGSVGCFMKLGCFFSEDVPST